MNDPTNTALATWDPNSGAALPAYLTDAMTDLGTNIQDRQNVPSLSYEGKTWTLVKDGNKTKLQMTNQDGDIIPVSVMRMVILNYNGERGRAYYPGVYNPAESKQPDCWSPDGKAPDPSSAKKQASACSGCPQSVKGSKVQDGKEMVACGSHRMIAIAPVDGLADDPYRLKIAVTSDWDKQTVEHGWFAFTQYTDYLKSRGITNTGLVVTKVKFDPNTAFPKLLFALDRLLGPAEVAQVKQALANPKVAELLAEKWSAAGAAGVDKNDADTRPWGLEGAYADGWTAHPDSAGWSYKGTEVLENAVLAARYPEPPPPAIPEVAKPDPVAPAAPAVPATPEPAPPGHDPIAAAVADGWIAHPSSPGWYYKGDVVIETEKLAAQYPETHPEPAAPAVPAAPTVPAAPVAAPEPAHDPRAAAVIDGWVQHPDSAPHGYKGTEVLEWPAIEAKYPAPGNAGASVGTPSAPAAESGQTATSGASPSSPVVGSEAVPAEVSALLNKWTS